MSLTVVFAAGGTGGHLMPAFAIADAVAAQRPDARIVFVGTEYGLEKDLVPAAGYEIRMTGVRPFAGGVAGARAVASVIPAVRAARTILDEVGASVVIGMGGYPSVPVVLAARTRRIPIVVHEANAVPGLANNVAARVTPHIAATFPGTAFKGRAPLVTGMPLREAIVSLDREASREEARTAFGLPLDGMVVLALGGSLGASSITRAVVALGERWGPGSTHSILVAAGRGFDEASAAAGPKVRVERFIERMDLAYAAADVAVARSGASTVSELAAVGLPSILVPYPNARRGEQHRNASLLTEVDAAVLLEDAQLSAERLDDVLAPLLADEERLAAMGKAARSMARTDAAGEIARWALDLAGQRR